MWILCNDIRSAQRWLSLDLTFDTSVHTITEYIAARYWHGLITSAGFFDDRFSQCP
jgi:hypothetical protein